MVTLGSKGDASPVRKTIVKNAAQVYPKIDASIFEKEFAPFILGVVQNFLQEVASMVELMGIFLPTQLVSVIHYLVDALKVEQKTTDENDDVTTQEVIDTSEGSKNYNNLVSAIVKINSYQTVN